MGGLVRGGHGGAFIYLGQSEVSVHSANTPANGHQAGIARPVSSAQPWPGSAGLGRLTTTRAAESS
jgi:hypothetical protein